VEISLKYTYLDALALLGIGGAHPGGLQLTKQIFAKENINKDTKILDSGCGTGQTSAYLAQRYGSSITALDSNNIMIEKARKRFELLDLPIQAIVGSTENLPLQKHSFDIVISESVMAFTDIPKTIREFKRVLKPFGRLLAVEMTLEEPLTKIEEEELKSFYQVSNILTIEQWVIEFQKAGFQQIVIEKDINPIVIPTPENAPDFTLSENIEAEVFDILEYHKSLTSKYQHNLGYRVFRCQ
jgi:ubiquinone/menaquinone biosynthesis C-methylase UbiE